MSATKKTKELWLTKDIDGYFVNKKEPNSINYDAKEEMWIDNNDEFLCEFPFEELTNIKLKNGWYCKIEVKKIGDIQKFIA